MSPRVAAVITNYNYGHLVRRAIESVLAQSRRPDEIVVVDDGSTDDSLRILADYEHVVTVISRPNGGQAAAFNTAFSATTSDLVCLLDADDTWLTDKIARVLALYAENPDASLIFHRLHIVGAQGNRDGFTRPYTQIPPDLSRLTRKSGGHWPYPPTSGLSLGRAFIHELGPVPEADWTICADSFLAGMAPFFGSVAGTMDSLGEYHLHGSNLFSNDARSSRDKAFWRKRMQELLNHNHSLNLAFERIHRAQHLSLADVAEYQFARARSGHFDGVLELLRLSLSPPPFNTRSQLVRAAASALLRGAIAGRQLVDGWDGDAL